MPDIIGNSEQNDSLTKSNDGVNIMPKLKATSHFFIEGTDFSQLATQKFGAISETQFRTSSKVTFSGTKKIYAICKGRVFIQPQEGSTTKINLILKPFTQPIPSLSIKYFIYRGLNKSDFVDAANKIVSGTGITGFVDHITTEFEQYYSGESLPDFLGSFIGFPENASDQPVERLINQYYYKVTVTQVIDGDPQETSETAYELPTIPKGIHLGNATGNIAIDVVLNKGDYYIENDPNPVKLNLGFARLADSVLDLTTVTDGNEFLKKLMKESTTNFIDIAAFYGLHTNGSGKLFVDESTTALTTKDDIYNRLNGFITKNDIYLYIQSNRQRSYNFYGNYEFSSENSNNLKIGHDIDNLSETVFGTFGWPIHVYTPTDTNGNLTFQLITDNYQDANLYVQTGFLNSDHEENFIRNEYLISEPVEGEEALATTYTKEIQLNINVANSENVTALVQLIFEGKQIIVSEYNDPPIDNPISYVLKDIDDMFGLINAKTFNTSVNEFQLPTIVEEKLQVINFSNKSGSNDIGAIKHQIIKDRLQTVDESTYINRVTYETLMCNIKRESSPYINNGSASIDNTKSGMQTYESEQNNFYKPKTPYYLETKLFTDGSLIISGLFLKDKNGDDPTKKILGVTNEEIQQLIDLKINNNLINTKLYFKNVFFNENDSYISRENIAYKMYYLGIVAENNLGKLEFFQPSNIIKIYTIDNYIFYSKSYSEFIPNLTEIEYSNFEILEIE